MKNVFLKETEQKSKLYRNLLTDKLFILEGKVTDVSECNREYQFIYITNDEQIKEGDWIINETYNIEKAISHYNYKSLSSGCKKVVLTNDPNLIADGVQQVSSSFLSFYAENTPDYVEVTEDKVQLGSIGGTNYICFKYFLNFSSKGIKTENNILDKLKDYFKNTPRNKILSDWEETCKQTENVNSPTVNKFIEVQKQCSEQDTLEEAFKEYYKIINYTKDSLYKDAVKRDFIAGAKWQAERMYSEEDMLKFAQIYSVNKLDKSHIDQFKKQTK